MYDRTELLLLAHAKASADRITLRTLSKKVFGPMNDKTFVRLAAGHGCNDASLTTASAWFDANADRSWWPADVQWPETKAPTHAERTAAARAKYEAAEARYNAAAAAKNAAE